MNIQKIIFLMMMFGLTQDIFADMFEKKTMYHYVGYQKHLAKKMKNKE